MSLVPITPIHLEAAPPDGSHPWGWMLNLATMRWDMGCCRWLFWKRLWAGGLASMLALGILSGCQPTFLSREVFIDANLPLPTALEQKTCPITEPITART